MNLKTVILLYFIYSFVGWFMETIGNLIINKKFINRGFLIGPVCPVYGTGAVLVTLLLNRFLDKPIVIFILAMIICAVVEYVTGYLMEKLFHARWWDYSNNKFNLNGRVCLFNLLLFGTGCLLLLLFVNPFFIRIINLVPQTTQIIIIFILVVLYVIDLSISIPIIYKIRNSLKKYGDSTEKISEYINKQVKMKYKRLYNRLLNAFPNIKIVIKK